MEKKYDLLTVGFPMVEIMRKERGVGFGEIGDFTGPYPSADTCIMLDVAARLGRKCCLLGVAADDIFGSQVIDRLKKDGVDVSKLRKVREMDTPVVYVRYEKDGKREYLQTFAETATAAFGEEDVDTEAVRGARCIHFSGEVILMCTDEKRRDALLHLLDNIDSDTLVSLDPNFTGWDKNVRKMLSPFVERADVVFPSEGEAHLLLETDSDEEACRKMAAAGKTVAFKRGKEGCDIYRGENKFHVDAFEITEVDPTGCGDSFCAGFLTGILEGMSMEEAGCLANAAGALQATRFGPMEGAMYRREVDAFIQNKGKWQG